MYFFLELNLRKVISLFYDKVVESVDKVVLKFCVISHSSDSRHPGLGSARKRTS